MLKVDHFLYGFLIGQVPPRQRFFSSVIAGRIISLFGRLYHLPLRRPSNMSRIGTREYVRDISIYRYLFILCCVHFKIAFIILYVEYYTF